MYTTIKTSGHKPMRAMAGKRFMGFLCVLCMAMFLSPDILADGTDPFSGAAATITGYADSVKSLLRAIAAVIILVGGFNVFHKMSNGDQDVKKTIMMTIGGCVAFVALSETLPKFFE